MHIQHATPQQKKFFRVVYRLAQQSVESLAFWSALSKLYSADLARHFKLITTNEDLLRVIGTQAKRTTIVTLFILIDHTGQGQKGHNIYRLAEMCDGFGGLTREGLLRPLKAESIKRTIRNVRILRNNLDAHHADNDEWRKNLRGENRRGLRELIHAIFQPLLRCGKVYGIRRLSAKVLETGRSRDFDRLIRALELQIRKRAVGQQYVSVERWEEAADDEVGPPDEADGS